MATPTIPNGEEHFFPIIYEGNGGGQCVGRFVPFTDSGTIANSCLIQPVAQRRLGRTPSSNGSGTTLTFSVWVKRTEFASTIRQIFIANDYASVGEALEFTTSNQLNYYCIRTTPGSYDWNYVTNRTFEDTSKWYHIMVARDTTDSTQADRIKIYVDGERITSFATEQQSGLNKTGWMNQTTYENTFGNTNNASIVRGVGYLAEVNMIDGQALLPASFGLTDTSTGRWIPSVVKPYPTTTTTFTVTVADASGNKYFIDSSQQATVTLIEGATYRFDQSDSSNAGHPLRFSTTSNGTHSSGVEFTSGVTTAGTPGSSGAYTEITVPVGTATLYYYCTNHSLMGGQANTQDAYGTNGFRLQFQDSSALGDDTSGNTNDLSATNLSALNQTTDSPTQNFATFSPNRTANSPTLSEGNLSITAPSSNYGKASIEKIFNSNISSGLYWEYTDGSTNGFEGGIIKSSKGKPQTSEGETDGVILQRRGSGGGNTYWIKKNDSDYADTSVSHSSGDKIGIAVKDNKIWFAVNNTWVLSGDPANGTNPASTLDDTSYMAMLGCYGSTTVSANFGQKSFNYTPPTGYVALQQDNLPSAVRGISDFLIIKNRDAADSWMWQDSLRGSGQYGSTFIATQYNTAITDGVQKFLAGGFSTEDNDAINTSGESYVAHNFHLNGGTTTTDTTGTLSTELQANATAGFSVGKFTVSGSGNVTWAHGLGGVPEMGILCAFDSTNYGTTYHHKTSSTPYNEYLLTTTDATVAASAGIWGSAKPTSTLWTGLVNSLFTAGGVYVFYSFRSIDGFSKFGSYTGNGNANGPFVYLGFRPAYVMIKRLTAGYHWTEKDTSRDPINPMTRDLKWNLTDAENVASANAVDFLSNGFKIRSASSGATNYNGSGATHIYMAFAEHPFVGDGTSPVTAR